MNFFQRMMAALQRFMTGRYGGMDSLNMFLITLYLLFAVFQLFFRTPVLYILSIVPAVLFLFRMLSRNIQARQKENNKFLELSGPVRRFFRRYIRRIRDGKSYKYFSCPNCHKELRVPRGRGSIEITCPRCHHQFHGKS